MDRSSNCNKIITAAVVMLLMLGVTVWLFNIGAFPSHSGHSITISKETTYLTKPIAKDGYINYERALNEQLSKGVTPKNNATVLFLRAYGPENMSKKFRKQYFKMLGVEPLPEKGNYFDSLTEYAKKAGVKGTPKPGTPEFKEWSEKLIQRYVNMDGLPWTRKEYPVIAGWLDAQEKQFELLIEGTRRPKMYSPLISSLKEEGRMLIAAGNFPGLTARPLARSLSKRAMLRLGERKVEQAHDDILACHRLARLIGQGPDLIDFLVATAIESMACSIDVQIVAHGNLTEKQAAQFQSDLENLKPIPRLIDKLNTAERYMHIEIIGVLVRDIPKEGADSVSDSLFLFKDTWENFDAYKPLKATVTRLITQNMIDWNEVLRSGNEVYDKMVMLGSATNHTYSERMRAIDKFDEDLEKRMLKSRKTLADPASHAKALFQSRKANGRMVADLLNSIFILSFSSAMEAEIRYTTRLQLTQLAYALAGYRARYGSYPQKLSQLAPRYIPKVPMDLFSGRSFRYEADLEDCLLYSVGSNGKDDGGQTFDSRPRGDDIVIDTRPKLENEKDDED